MDDNSIKIEGNLSELADKFEKLSKLLREIDGFEIKLITS